MTMLDPSFLFKLAAYAVLVLIGLMLISVSGVLFALIILSKGI